MGLSHSRSKNHEQLALCVECASSNPEIIVKLIRKYKCDLNSIYSERSTPLYVACLSGKLDVVYLLLKKYKNDVNSYDCYGGTPLHAACKGEHPDIVQLLLSFKCTIDKQDFDGNTALHVACARKRADIVRILVESRCQVDIIDKFGYTPLGLAVRGLDTTITRLLLDAGCRINFDGTVYCLLSTFLLNFTEALWKWTQQYTFNEDIFQDFIIEKATVMVTLSRAGYNLNASAQTLRPIFSFLDRFPFEQRMLKNIHIFFNWLKWQSAQPRTLQQLCRLTIRSQFGKHSHHKILQLNMPTRMKNYLNFSDLQNEESWNLKNQWFKSTP